MELIISLSMRLVCIHYFCRRRKCSLNSFGLVSIIYSLFDCCPATILTMGGSSSAMAPARLVLTLRISTNLCFSLALNIVCRTHGDVYSSLWSVCNAYKLCMCMYVCMCVCRSNRSVSPGCSTLGVNALSVKLRSLLDLFSSTLFTVPLAIPGRRLARLSGQALLYVRFVVMHLYKRQKLSDVSCQQPNYRTRRTPITYVIRIEISTQLSLRAYR